MTVTEYCAENPTVVGCETVPAPVPEVPVKGEPYNTLFSYDDLTTFTYQADLQVVKALISTDVEQTSSHGEDSVKLTSYTTLSETHIVMYVDPLTHGCTSTHTELEDGSIVEDLCPVEGLNSKFAATTGLLDAGEEHITVLAGAYDTQKLTADGVTYWVAEGIPLPVQYAGEGYVMELVSYE